jgi:hypothetical protein
MKNAAIPSTTTDPPMISGSGAFFLGLVLVATMVK